MNFQALAILAVILVTFTSLAILTVLNWRVRMISLAVQYIGIFSLVAISWPLEMAAAKLVAGWISAGLLATAIIYLPPAPAFPENENPEHTLTSFPVVEEQTPSSLTGGGQSFRLLAAILVGLVVLSVAPQLVEWAPKITMEQAWGGLILVCMGLLQLGFTTQPFSTILGLLTTLGGFEVLYAPLEASLLMTGLLAGINLSLALIGIYLFNVPSMEESL